MDLPSAVRAEAGVARLREALPFAEGRKESIMKYLGRYNYDKMLAWERDFAERLVICPVYDSSGFTCIGYDLYYI